MKNPASPVAETPATDLAAMSTGVQKNVAPARAPDITPQQVAKNLGTKMPFAGGAMAFHPPKAMATTGLSGTHKFSGASSGIGHTIHSPRLQG